jgi:two-component sensor histidine kinase
MRTLLVIFLFFSLTVTSQNSFPKNYTRANGLPTIDINSITQDSIGYLWLASPNKGIIRFDGQVFESFTKNDGLISDEVHHLLYSNDSLFIATEKGLSIKVNHTFINVAGEKTLKIKKIGNRILLATTQGISKYSKGKIVPIKLNYQIDLGAVYDIAYFNNGYYIATFKTLWYVNSLTAPTKIVRINEGMFSSLSLLNNKLFATTKNKGVQVFETNKNQILLKDVKRITSIDFSDNQYWISTDNNGVYIYDADFNFKKRISKYNGLKANHISQVFIDRTKNHWLATKGSGLYKFPSETLISDKSMAAIHFENIEVDYQTVDSIPFNHYKKTLYLQPSQNNISFSFKSVDINAITKMEYQWKLNDKKSPWSARNDIAFANLEPGKYTFQVQSRNSTPIKFLFFIDTPIYKRDWFVYSLVVIGLLIVIVILNAFRKKNIKKMQRLKLENHLLSLEQKALQLQMNPHFIFNVLNGVKALGSQGNTEEMNDTINHFASLLRGVLNNSRKEEISLQQEIDTLKRYVLLEQQMATETFDFNVDTTKIKMDLDEILIPPMLIQPFIENAIKHGVKSLKSGGSILVSFSIKDTFLICKVIDNGIGYKKAKKQVSKDHRSVALKVTKERIENISGGQSFYISEVIENKRVIGTKVWLRIPLKTEF